MLMGVFISLVMSFAMLAINVGFVSDFITFWLNSFIVGFIVATPIALVAVPIIGKIVKRLTAD